MGCCGQKREALRSNPSPTVTATPAVTKPTSNNWSSAGTLSQQAPVAGATAYSMVTLQYLENSPILVRGPVTGRLYEFSNAQPVQSVDLRDAETLLRTGFFRRTY